MATSTGANLVNAEGVRITFGTRTVLDGVSLGLNAGEVIGVVGRNGDGKTTLLSILTGAQAPDEGRVTRNGSVHIGTVTQAEKPDATGTVRDLIVDGQPDHTWAADAYSRGVVAHLLSDIDLDAPLATLSGGERRRTALVSLMLGRYDLLVLDEPTNHLDVEAVAWLADHLNTLAAAGTAMLVVSHDRWFLDAVCTRIWEVHDGVVDAYDGGYAAYVLARAERARQAASNEQRRANLVRKELAWLRRGAPARTSKPRFRMDAAAALIADEPPPRDRLQLEQFAASRLGRDVLDLRHVDLTVPGPRTLLRDLTWSIGPGARIGIVGVNGSGKTTLLRLLAGELEPTAGQVKQGRTVRLAHLSQHVGELDGRETVLDSVNGIRRETRLANGDEVSASTLLEDFGFTGSKLTTRIGDLSGGERRRLQLLRLLLSEPNVLLLDEPTNDLDIDTLTVIEDHLDRWPGTLVVVSHDRYLLERVCDVTYALFGDGTCLMLPGGVDQYLEQRMAVTAASSGRAAGRSESPVAPATVESSAGSPSEVRAAKKQLSKIEGQLAKLSLKTEQLHAEMAAAAADHVRLTQLHADLEAVEADQARLEDEWLAAAEILG